MKSIAVIDSGSGGLTVANKLFDRLPGERIIYVGDHGNCPYGNKTEKEIREAVYGVIRFLGRFELKLLVVACNTATALMLDDIRKMLDFPVIGVIEPGAEMAAGATRNGKVGVIATRRTAESHMYQKMITDKLPGVSVFEQACPKLVGFLESDENREAEIASELELNLAPLRAADVDTLVMGCTHYPLAENQILKSWGAGVSLIDPARGTAERAYEALKEKGELSGGTPEEHLFYTTGDAVEFSEKVKKWTPILRPVVRPVTD
ncbi:glutamate racemase [Bhargavaea ullalensis]|uniref:Glutamate racemase n=1 Tax=Bhargavaea ullalensis TaxID=1265685 RepID=A0ABV2G7F2_9BACL